MTTNESKGRFFLLNESIRIDSHNESNRIDSNRELEFSIVQALDTASRSVLLLGPVPPSPKKNIRRGRLTSLLFPRAPRTVVTPLEW